MKIKVFHLIIFFSIPNLTFAAFEVSPNDVSSKILGYVFGTSVGWVNLNDGTINPTLNLVMAQFNTAIITIGLLLLSYVSVFSFFAGGTDIKQQTVWGSVWIPIKAALGILMLVPTHATGYSVIQAFVMWAVIQGIGAANMLWSVTITGMVDSGVGIASTGGGLEGEITKNAKVPTLVESLLYTAMCQESLRHFFDKRNDDTIVTSEFAGEHGSKVQLYRLTLVEKEPSTNKFTNTSEVAIGVKNHPNPIFHDICGKYEVVTTMSKSKDDPNDKLGNLKAYSLSIHNRKIEALNSALFTYRSLTTAITRDKNLPHSMSNPKTAPFMRVQDILPGAIGSYARLLAGFTIPIDSSQFISNPDEIISQGWAFAPSYMTKLIGKANNLKLFPTIENELPSTSGVVPSTNSLTDGLNELSDDEKFLLKRYLKAAKKYYDANSDLNKYSAPIELSTSGVDGSVFIKIFLGLTAGGASEFINFLKLKDDQDPLIEIGKVGERMMKIAEITWISITLGSMALALASAICSCASPGESVFKALSMTIVLAILGTAVMMWSFGATLGIYIPMIPYIVFMGAILGWLFLVVEAIFAAPLLALGLATPAKNDLGSMGPGLDILTNLIFKPSLLLIGFVFSIRIFKSAVVLVNKTFLIAMQAVPAYDGASLLQLDKMVSMIIYVSLILAFMNKCAEFITLPANSITKFYGGQTQSDHAMSIAKETQSKAEQGIEAVGESLKGSASAAQSSATKEKEGEGGDKKEKGGDKSGGKGGSKGGDKGGSK